MPASLFPPAQDIFMAAVASTKEGGQPVAFRRACVELGLVTQLVQLLARANEPSLQPARRSALAALAAIATDDPTSDVDNDHALAVCSAGVVPYVVDALSAPDREVQLSGAGCMAVLAEEPRCTKLLLNEGAVPHLLSLASYGPSHGVRATALAAIEQLSHDPDARETLIHLGTLFVRMLPLPAIFSLCSSSVSPSFLDTWPLYSGYLTRIYTPGQSLVVAYLLIRENMFDLYFRWFSNVNVPHVGSESACVFMRSHTTQVPRSLKQPPLASYDA